jgi:hypothetical protein
MDDALYGMDKLYILGTHREFDAKYETQITQNLIVKKSKPRRHSSGNENQSSSRLCGEPGQMKRKKRRIRVSMQKRRRRSAPVHVSEHLLSDKGFAHFPASEISTETYNVLDNVDQDMECNFNASPGANAINIGFNFQATSTHNSPVPLVKHSTARVPIIDFLKVGNGPPTAVPCNMPSPVNGYSS